jgi:solute carrier family 25 iron transporter 28/37
MLRHLIRTEGASSLYRSLPITIAMNVPQSALFMTFYENLKSFLFPDGKVSMAGYFTCAGIAGSVSAGLTTPFDVIKTRLQTQHEESKLVMKEKTVETQGQAKYLGIRSTFKHIWQTEGLKGFYRGLVPRMMIFLPGAAISWSSYEYIKRLLDS